MNSDPPVKIAFAQLNLLVGDIERNTQEILEQASDAIVNKHCDLVIFTELAITGYPPEDLLFRSECLDRVEKALDRLLNNPLPGHLLVGHPRRENGKRYNTASLISNGKIIAQYDKQRLPNYSVFDEKRYFTPGHQPQLFEIKGKIFAIQICEDLWHPGCFEIAAQKGATAIICINASPFHLQKPKKRLAILKTRQEQEVRLPILYVNCVGGQDELIFDGGSFLLDADGNIVEQAPYFQESLYCFNFPSNNPSQAFHYQEIEHIYQALILSTKDYCNKNRFPKAIVALSGGIDSALTLTIAVDALGPDRVEALLMPSRYTSDMSVEDAEELCQQLGVNHHSIDIEMCFQAFLDSLSPIFSGLASDETEENIQARCRGILLMALSNKFGYLVLTTGNKSELAVGYATLYGDMAGGFAILKDLLKTQVYQLANYRNALSPVIPQRIIDRSPSAELKENQCDQDTLPPYELLDQIIHRFVVEDQCHDQMVKAGLDSEVVKKVIHLIENNEYKRRQAPPGIRISSRAFGRDWRYPITSGFGRRE